MVLDVLTQVAVFFLNIFYFLLPDDFIVSGLDHTEIPTIFNGILAFMAQWNFIFPVDMLLKVVALILGLMLIKFTVSVVRFLLNIARGSGA